MGERSAQAEPRALPRYLTLEVRSGGVHLAGELLEGEALDAALEAGARDQRNQGAALIFFARSEQAAALLTRVQAAGFTHVVISGLGSGDSRAVGERAPSPGPAPSVVEVDAPAPRAEVKEPAPSAAGSPPVGPQPADVTVKHYGLHIGGGPNTDEARAAYLVPIEQTFEQLRRCHALAKNRDTQASFGVDLHVPHAGGRAKIQDYRTSIKGQEFQACVLEALGGVSFPAPGRTTVVSYSVLFKPTAD